MLPFKCMRRSSRSSLLALAILGGLTSVGVAAPRLQVSFKTTPIGAEWAPSNIVAVWIEGPSPGPGDPGPFVKTIGRWAGLRVIHLVAWQNMAGPNDADAVSGATRLDHSAPLSVEWDLKDKDGNLVPDGLYTIRMETADGNSTATGQNWQGTFTFTKGPARDTQTILDDPHYPNVSIDYDPTALECNNGVIDPGETCDPPGSCVTTCEVSADACNPIVLVGSAAACNAACSVVPITTCISGDGCCAEGCTPVDDGDCVNEETVDGGCTTGAGNGAGALGALALLGAGLLVTSRRRRR